ncbi:hypothetical protein CGMCC3_g1308 [Colletotrichum fructicola]|nr:uncharacterized protein CGMCC3_g1308 [Colletotrichum fructicola]KAE9582488.1 hypothetical protein CGMCC3_g1308 [Colletotrichum fructicola]
MSALFAVVASALGFAADSSAATATITLPAVTTTLNSLVTTTLTLPVTVSGSCTALPPITIQHTVTAYNYGDSYLHLSCCDSNGPQGLVHLLYTTPLILHLLLRHRRVA